jgi:hypothetical protein
VCDQTIKGSDRTLKNLSNDLANRAASGPHSKLGVRSTNRLPHRLSFPGSGFAFATFSFRLSEMSDHNSCEPLASFVNSSLASASSMRKNDLLARKLRLKVLVEGHKRPQSEGADRAAVPPHFLYSVKRIAGF